MRNRRQLLSATCMAALSVLAQETWSADVTITWTDVKQEIDGFGACSNYRYADNTTMNMSEATRTDFFDFLFDSTKGIGLSTLRIMTPEDHEPSKGVWNFTTVGTKNGYIMQQAQLRGVKKIWLAPWSPPLWMKTINNISDGSLKPECYQDYADYMSRVIQEYKIRYGVDIWGQSVQNEPHFDAPWEACTYTGAQIRDFVKYNLGPTFRRDGLATKIILPESNWAQSNWADPTMIDSIAASYTDVIAFHEYEGEPYPYPRAQPKGKRLWQTETCWTGGQDDGMGLAMDFVKKLHKGLTYAKCNAWHYWMTIWSDREGVVRSSGNGFVKIKWAYAFGQYSKFIRPGWHMIGAANRSADSLFVGVSAFRDTARGTFAVVAVNFDKLESHTVTFTLKGFRTSSVTPWCTDSVNSLAQTSPIAVSGGMFAATLPPYSVRTFCGTGQTLTASDVDVDSFTASPRYCAPGGQVALAWSTKNATSVSISGGPGAIAAFGAVTVSPAQTTIYTLTAQGPNGPMVRTTTVSVLTPREPDNPSPTVAGLEYQYYEGVWPTIPDVNSLTPKKTGTYPYFYATVPGYAPANYLIRYKGYIDVPAIAMYTFFTKSDNATKLYIGSTLVVDNDKGTADERCGDIFLKAGKHAITLDFHQTVASTILTVSWQASDAGIAKIKIPATRLYRIGTPAGVIDTRLHRTASPACPQAQVFDIRGKFIARTSGDLPNRSKNAISGVVLVRTSKDAKPRMAVVTRGELEK